MNEKTKKVIGWVLSGLLAAMLIVSGIGKFMGAATPMMEHFGFTASETTLIATGEIISAILFLIPKTQSLGTLLLSAYMGGAIASHMSASVGTEELGGEDVQSYLVSSIFLVVIWVASIIRNPATLSSFRS